MVQNVDQAALVIDNTTIDLNRAALALHSDRWRDELEQHQPFRKDLGQLSLEVVKSCIKMAETSTHIDIETPLLEEIIRLARGYGFNGLVEKIEEMLIYSPLPVATKFVRGTKFGFIEGLRKMVCSLTMHQISSIVGHVDYVTIPEEIRTEIQLIQWQYSY